MTKCIYIYIFVYAHYVHKCVYKWNNASKQAVWIGGIGLLHLIFNLHLFVFNKMRNLLFSSLQNISSSRHRSSNIAAAHIICSLHLTNTATAMTTTMIMNKLQQWNTIKADACQTRALWMNMSAPFVPFYYYKFQKKKHRWKNQHVHLFITLIALQISFWKVECIKYNFVSCVCVRAFWHLIRQNKHTHFCES